MNEEIARAAGRYRAAIEQTLDASGNGSGTGFRIALGRCESPIEQAYCLELFQVPNIVALPGDFDGAILSRFPTVSSRFILVFAQQPILRYRADFLLVGGSPLSAEPIFVIVECDGEDFHSAREQRRRDEARQRALHNTGFKVIRFWGSEIHREPQRVITNTLAQFQRQGWNPDHCPKWVNDREFLSVLAQFREIGGASRAGPPRRSSYHTKEWDRPGSGGPSDFMAAMVAAINRGGTP
jgi:very-short-patch-repair endonuclease